MNERLYRIVDGVEERLCWRFAVHGRLESSYEPADGDRGPYDPDRRRRLQRGETFQRLDRSGRPRIYQGLAWRAASMLAETPTPLATTVVEAEPRLVPAPDPEPVEPSAALSSEAFSDASVVALVEAPPEAEA
jgi:hypothetical protein